MGREHRPLNLDALRGVRRSEAGPGGGDYQVQYVRGSEKAYVCPGCLQQVSPGTEHVVVWPEEAAFGHAQGVEARRHWHRECWRRKLRPQ